MMYTAIIEDDFSDETPVSGCGCDAPPATLADVAEINECCLTPGDPSPAGRCSNCESLVYVDTPQARARDAAPAMLALLRELGNFDTPDELAALDEAEGRDCEEQRLDDDRQALQAMIVKARDLLAGMAAVAAAEARIDAIEIKEGIEA